MEANYWMRKSSVSRRRFVATSLTAGVGIAGAALIGCGGDSPTVPNGGAGTPSGAAGTPSGAAGTPAPEVSDGYINLVTRWQPGLDPLEIAASVTERNSLVYGRLIDTVGGPDMQHPADTEMVPGYSVEGWELTDGGTTLVFKLKQGIKFQNVPPVSGREQVAEDVRWSIDRGMTHERSQFKSGYADIEKMETPDDYTIVFTLKRVSRYIMGVLAQEPTFIMPKELDGMDGGVSANMIGSGPFIMEELREGEGILTRKNPDFVNAQEIYYERFDAKAVTDSSRRIAAVKTGEADDGAAMNQETLQIHLGPSIESYQAPVIGCNFISYNMNNPKWADVRVRTAVSKAYDRQAIIDQLFGGDGAFNGPIPIGFGDWGLSEEELRELNANKYDPAEAKKLWDAAGSPFTNIDWYPPPPAVQPQYQPMAELIAGLLTTNLGIDQHTYSSDDYAVWLPNAYQGGAPDMTLGGWGDGAEPLNNLIWEYLPGGSRNFSNVNDQQAIDMIEDVIGILDDTEAKKKTREISTYVADEVVASVKPPIPFQYAIHNPRLEGYYPGIYPYGYDWRFRSWKTQ